jgi:phosphoribosylglycinamide formyltransferase-1
MGCSGIESSRVECDRSAEYNPPVVRLGILASHEGTTLQSVLDACAAGTIPCRVVVVISNNREARALERARAGAVPALHLSSETHPDPAALDTAICQALLEAGVELVLLAGYMKRIGPHMIARFRGRILNTHPALLPKFGGQGMYGLHVHRAVLAAGEKVTGPSIHLVTEEYDAGPVIAQREVAVHQGDTPETLALRVQECERILLVETLGSIAHGHLRLPGFGT